MKERPIIMGAASVRAILDGTKTQTRRVVQPQWPAFNCHPKEHSAQPGVWIAYTDDGRMRNADGDRRCPYGVVGDRLWVKEGFYRYTGLTYPERRYGDVVIPATDPARIRYRADADLSDASLQEQSIWCPVSPLFMPRRHSRLTLAIAAIRVQRLQDISEADAIAEGILCEPDRVGPQYGPRPGEMTNRTAMAAYLRHWNTLNEKRGYPWQANPWVWVVEFARVEEAS